MRTHIYHRILFRGEKDVVRMMELVMISGQLDEFAVLDDEGEMLDCIWKEL